MRTIMPLPDTAPHGARYVALSFLSLWLTVGRFPPIGKNVARTLERRSTAGAADAGFTMIESLVALAVISVVMASMGTYFVSSMRVSRSQAQLQVALRIAQTGMEQARGISGPTLLSGRARCGSCFSVAAFDTSGYMLNTVRWDAPVTGATPSVPLPSTTEVTVVNGITYSRYYFVGRCFQADTGGFCGTNETLKVPMVRLVVGVTWSERSCPVLPGIPVPMCIRAATALYSAEPSDPLFTQS
jgi:prepilin-type N-terminal cleavage/methylation domain-containing protein